MLLLFLLYVIWYVSFFSPFYFYFYFDFGSLFYCAMKHFIHMTSPAFVRTPSQTGLSTKSHKFLDLMNTSLKIYVDICVYKHIGNTNTPQSGGH